MSVCSSIVLGIDPGSLRTGFGVVQCDAYNKVHHVAHGTIVLDKKKVLTERLADLAHDLKTVMEKYRPSHAVVEDIFFFKNAGAALVLGQARGTVLALLGLQRIPVLVLAPTQAKALVTGNGRAKKFQMAHMVALELGIAVPSSEDASDALGLALAHCYQKRLQF